MFRDLEKGDIFYECIYTRLRAVDIIIYIYINIGAEFNKKDPRGGSRVVRDL